MWPDRRFPGEGRPPPVPGRILIVASLAMALLHHVEATVWAAVYLGLDALADWDSAIYFPIVTMTTVGYGDVILSGGWRLLAAFQALTGRLVFGLSAAFLFAVQNYWSPVRRGG
jgi:hypothetical protein